MTQEMIVLNPERNVTLTAYTMPVGGRFDYIPKRPAILVIPGGGYQYCSVFCLLSPICGRDIRRLC